MQQNSKVVGMVEIALFTAIVIVLASTPIGYIPLSPTINATTVHIPVIIAGIILGWKKGAIIGALFGLTSFVRASFISPSLSSFLFSPLYPGGNGWSLVICFLPRILIGIVAAFVFLGLKKLVKNETVSLAIAGVAGSLTNTILVMGMACVFFADEYAKLLDPSVGDVFKYVLQVVIIGNGVPEAILAGVLTVGICKALLVVNKNRVIR